MEGNPIMSSHMERFCRSREDDDMCDVFVKP